MDEKEAEARPSIFLVYIYLIVTIINGYINI